LPGAVHELVGRQDLVDEAPAMRLLNVQPAAGEQHVHGDVVGNALRQLDRGGIGHRAGADFRQGEGRVLGGEDEVGRQRDLEAAAAADAVDGGDDRLVEVAQLLHAAETADAI